jgi:hypothetical protein
MKIILALLLLTPGVAATKEDPLGTWRLGSARSTLVATGEQSARFGELIWDKTQ